MTGILSHGQTHFAIQPNNGVNGGTEDKWLQVRKAFKGAELEVVPLQA